MPAYDRFIELYEQKVTEISARITGFMKEAGYNSPEGSRLGWILHEVNGAFSTAYTLIELLKIRVAALELQASAATPEGDRIMLERLVRDHRLAQLNTPELTGQDVTDADQELVEAIIRAGWVSPNRIVAERPEGE